MMYLREGKFCGQFLRIFGILAKGKFINNYFYESLACHPLQVASINACWQFFLQLPSFEKIAKICVSPKFPTKKLISYMYFLNSVLWALEKAGNTNWGHLYIYLKQKTYFDHTMYYWKNIHRILENAMVCVSLSSSVVLARKICTRISELCYDLISTVFSLHW